MIFDKLNADFQQSSNCQISVIFQENAGSLYTFIFKFVSGGNADYIGIVYQDGATEGHILH